MKQPTFELRAADIPDALRRSLATLTRSRKRVAVIAEQVTIPSDAGLSSGGSRDRWFAVRLADGAVLADPMSSTSPWARERTERTGKLTRGVAMVEHSVFCGKDCGLRIYVHPLDVVAGLPAAAQACRVYEQQQAAAAEAKRLNAGELFQ